jgi:hypothetical protein
MGPPRAVFVGDWFRAYPALGSGPGTARTNLVWIAGLLSRALKVPLAKQTLVMPADTEQGYLEQLGSAPIARAYREDPQRGWLESYDGCEARTAFTALYDRLPPDALVIGFELPPVMRRTLSAGGWRYVSVHVHPLRFLPDLTIGVYSNCAAMRAALAAITVPRSAIERQVARLSARIGRLNPPQAHLPDDCAVMFGQTPADASLIVDRRFASWSDYADKLAALIGPRDVVAYIKHPHARWPVALLDWLGNALGLNVIAMEGNSYPVIMSGRPIGPVASLSSSVGVEAAAFGHDSHFLIADPRHAFAVPGIDNAEQIMVGHQFLEPGMWECALGGAKPDGPMDVDPFFLGPGHIRSTLESWSFAGLEGTGTLPACKKIIVPAPRCGKAERDRLRVALGATAKDRDLADESPVDHWSLPFALAPGETWHWDKAEERLDFPGLDGLGSPDEDGIWLSGEGCTIRLPLAPSGGRELWISGELRFSFFRGLLDRHPVLLVRANGRPVAAWIHRGQEDPYHDLSFAFPATSDGICRVTLEVSHADNPCALGMGGDTRELSIIVHSVSLCASEAEVAGDAVMMSLWGFGDHPIEIPSDLDWQEHVAKQ